MISPILAPASLLAKFPPTFIVCGESDPFADDSLLFAARIRDAKMAERSKTHTMTPKERDQIKSSVDLRIIEGWSQSVSEPLSYDVSERN